MSARCSCPTNLVAMVLSLGAEGVRRIVEITEWVLADTRNSADDESSGHVVLTDHNAGVELHFSTDSIVSSGRSHHRKRRLIAVLPFDFLSPRSKR